MRLRHSAFPAVLVLVASCGQATTKYTDPAKAFSLHYPAPWTAGTEAGAAVFSAPGSGPRASLVVTRVPRKDGAITRTETSLLENLMIQFKALPGFSLLASKPADVAGLDAQLVSVTFMNRDHRYRKDQYVIPLSEHFLIVDCNAPESAFDEKLFSQLLSTLEVSK